MTMNTMIDIERIAVIGGGSWGTALAGRLAANGNDTVLWAYEPELVAESIPGRNRSSLGSTCTRSACTGNLEEAVSGAAVCCW